MTWADVVVIGNRAIEKATLARHLRPEQMVIDLVNLEKPRRPDRAENYEGICW
jgi:hypothetical protein